MTITRFKRAHNYPYVKPPDPILPPIHNPREISEHIMEPEKGWRFFRTDEVHDRMGDIALPDTEMWFSSNAKGSNWVGNVRGNDECSTYRTKLPYPVL